MTPYKSACRTALLQGLVWLVYAMDKADEDVIDTDTAVGWMESVAFLLHRLPSKDRQDLALLTRSLADETADHRLRSAYLKFIEGFGLTRISSARRAAAGLP